MKQKINARRALTARQHVAIIQTLKWLDSTGKAVIGSINEVYSWIEYQISNPDYHFQGKGFKYCLSIVKKMLCNTGIGNIQDLMDIMSYNLP